MIRVPGGRRRPDESNPSGAAWKRANFVSRTKRRSAVPQSSSNPTSRHPSQSPGRLFWNRFREDRLAMASLIFIGILILIAIFAPVVVSIVGAPDPNARDTGALDPLFATPDRPLLDALVRDRPARPRRLQPDGLRRPRLADRRLRGDRHRDGLRGRRRPARRLLPGLDRHADLPLRRRPARDPLPAARHRPRRRLHARPDQRRRRRLPRRPDQARPRRRHLRDRVHELDLHGADRPRPGPVAAREGVRRGVALDGRLRHCGSSSASCCRT